MIDIITGHQAYRRMALTTEMYRLRHRVFKERLGWDVDSANGLEIDQFDSERARYLLAYDDNENLSGTWRLLPTTGAYMLRDVFPQLLEGRPAPCSSMIWETSRFAVDSVPGAGGGDDLGLNSPQQITRELFMGLVEFCIHNGVKQVYTVYDIRIARLLPRIGCRPFWQSRPQRVGKTTAIAGAFDTTSEVLERIRELAGIRHSVIRLAPWSPQLMVA